MRRRRNSTSPEQLYHFSDQRASSQNILLNIYFFLFSLRRVRTAAGRNVRIAASRDSSRFPRGAEIRLETEEGGGRQRSEPVGR